MRNNGWRTITIPERLEALSHYNKLPEKTQEEIRDKAILRYFLMDNLSASAISRKEDPAIVCLGNRNRGKPLTASSIIRIIYQHCPYLKKERNNRENDKRVLLMRKRRAQKSEHIKQCAFCGSKENLEEHHMIPLSMGGTNDDENLIFLCHSCHLGVTIYQGRVKKGIC